MVNFPVFADDFFGGGAVLSEGFATLNPRLFHRFAFPCFARFPHLFATEPKYHQLIKFKSETRGCPTCIVGQPLSLTNQSSYRLSTIRFIVSKLSYRQRYRSRQEGL